MARIRALPAVAGGVVVAFVLVVLLAPQHTDLPIAWLSRSHLLGTAANGGTPLWWALENTANIALFVPLGAVLALHLRPAMAVSVAICTSVCCETAQLWIPTRHASLLDVAMNSIGAAVGVAALLIWRRANVRRPAQRLHPTAS